MGSMEPPTDHRGSEVLSASECDELLASTPVGRVAFILGGEPHILPVNYRYVDQTIVIRSTTGSKMEAAEMHRRFAFEIDEWDTDTRRGWSVLAHGMGTVEQDEAEIRRFEDLGLHPWTENDTEADLWIRIRLDDVSGRRIG